MDNIFKIGKIVNTQGLKGQVRVYPYTSDKERFEELDVIYLNEKLTESLEIESVGYKKNLVILKFKGFNKIEDVEKLRERDIFINRETQGLDLEEDEFYIADLIGLEVIDEKAGFIGKLDDILQNTTQDLYVVKREVGPNVLIPYVDEFVREINVEEGFIKVCLWDGMLEWESMY